MQPHLLSRAGNVFEHLQTIHGLAYIVDSNHVSAILHRNHRGGYARGVSILYRPARNLP